MTKLISVQINGQNDVVSNLSKIDKVLSNACTPDNKDELVVLPECCTIFGVSGKKMLASAEVIGSGKAQQTLRNLAIKHGCTLVCGTMPIVEQTGDDKYSAASLVFDPQGQLVSRYNKIHLFDVDVADNTSVYRESKYTKEGQSLAVFDSSCGTVAQAVCYDLRFSEMFAAYAKLSSDGAAPHVIVLPSAFTKVTGQAHWHALLKARSIENQCFVVASNQTGIHADGRETFGNSCIYSPWGECLDLIEEGDGYASASFSLAKLQNIRTKMPVQAHKKERYSIEF